MGGRRSELGDIYMFSNSQVHFPTPRHFFKSKKTHGLKVPGQAFQISRFFGCDTFCGEMGRSWGVGRPDFFRMIWYGYWYCR